MKFALGDLVQDSRNLVEWGDSQGQWGLVPRVVEYKEGALVRAREGELEISNTATS